MIPILIAMKQPVLPIPAEQCTITGPVGVALGEVHEMSVHLIKIKFIKEIASE